MPVRRYQHSIPPEDYERLLEYVERELSEVSASIDSVANGETDVFYTEPARVYPGMILYADGTEWNPGSGEGIYRYSLAGTWVFVG